jgi:hypothetical protein
LWEREEEGEKKGRVGSGRRKKRVKQEKRKVIGGECGIEEKKKMFGGEGLEEIEREKEEKKRSRREIWK